MYTRNHEHSTNVCYYLFFSVCFLFWFSLYFWLLIKTVVSDVQAFKQPKYNKNNDILSTNMFFGVHAVEHIDWIVFGNGRLLFLRSFWATTITSVNDNNERMKTNILLAKWMLCVHIDFRRGSLAVFYLYSVLYYYYLLISVFLVIVDVFFFRFHATYNNRFTFSLVFASFTVFSCILSAKRSTMRTCVDVLYCCTLAILYYYCNLVHSDC